eukprot:8619820-Alexandrium_andersonii.AAC.1
MACSNGLLRASSESRSWVDVRPRPLFDIVLGSGHCRRHSGLMMCAHAAGPPTREHWPPLDVHQ